MCGLDAKIDVTNVFNGKKVLLIKTLPDGYFEFEIIRIIVVVCSVEIDKKIVFIYDTICAEN